MPALIVLPIVPLFQTVSTQIHDLDPRDSLIYMNSFMKNVLITSYNNLVHLCAALKRLDKQTYQVLMKYIIIFCDMVALHLQGDEQFFSKAKVKGGKNLCQILGAQCSPNSSDYQRRLKDLKTKAQGKGVTDAELTSMLLFFPELVGKMALQLRSLDSKRLKQVVSQEELADMITDNVAWIAANADNAALVPFVLAHHDKRSSAFWPHMQDVHRKAVPKLADVYSSCWKLAPFDPVSQKPRSK